MDTIYAGLEKQKIKQIVERIMDQREQFAAAFIAATGLHPTECEQVEKRCTNPDGTITTRFHIRKRKKSCDWTYDPEYTKWDTDCGNSFQFTNDGPSENGAKYCQYCGRPINEIKDL